MTTLAIDDVTGRLLIKRTELAILSPDRVADDRLRPAIAALTDSRLSLQIQVSGPGGSAMHLIVVGEESAAIVLGVDDDYVDVVGVLPAAVPHVLAKVLSVGPRPRLGVGSIAVEDSVVEALLANGGSSPDALRTAASAWPDWAERFNDSGPWRVWGVVAGWRTESGMSRAPRSLVLVDNPLGMAWSANGQLHPTTPTEVLLMLIRLLDDLDEES